ncbi:NADH-quinone oxidoreductase subunit NuoK [Streptomyces sp. ST2-7A]|uniref:NADH-quinone oxidoreductase subunit NuoK n=1 Tax=Streptomyces sp. ST2-7A TaxID=2907214 RepID=UPI001F2B029E|nr:NADH-quinone oxidoreductase subunit NuoK [Streptomyces sp. ST2-7A]MCE7078865.1 NADH-quinone oxidoreductase subunit NuoK [Streptomyces sp. ST2-7A]
MHLVYPVVLAVLLFCVGLYGVLARRNVVLVLMSVELMLAGAMLNLVAFDVWLRDALHSGQVFTLFLIAVAAAEVGIGLAIVLLVYRGRGTSAVDRLRALRDTPAPPPPGADTGAPDPDPAGADTTSPAAPNRPTPLPGRPAP